MGIMSGFGLVLDMCRGDGDTTFALLRGLVNSAIFQKFCEAFFSLSLRDGSS